jgi:hypothetical protein
VQTHLSNPAQLQWHAAWVAGMAHSIAE